ncbi:putative MYG1-like protein [Encephalitozoon romaleae SJ-2008]|uniref:MYG1-like protein n=1 Tax=Encephalitozoon romaleae (strain SJ-2008) TaxID=1178016 RepID=I7ADT2_ENCRO|nr:putative MYG1-like protein [Encephalitozoon romaleae SJ-2008]AFN82745.1 putative MYG1-like protein [Encephalitozoon romaleae SJ-2008]
MKLVTHDERFHYDEVLASCVLLRIYPDAEIMRTRDNAIIEQGDIVYDVGGVFNPATRRFDHHQRTFSETFSSKYNVKLSSSGLIFKYFHKQLLSLYGIEDTCGIYNMVVDKIYSEFFLYADAIDNGQDIYGEIRPRTMADLVGLFNTDTPDEGLENRGFYKVLEIVSTDLDNYMKRIKIWVNNYEHVEKKARETNGPILVLDKHYTTDLILEIESQNGKDFKFMVFPHRNAYRVIAIPKRRGSFETKNPLKKEWRGLVNEELVRASGIEGCIFVHSSGFMGINSTFENALKMCEESLSDGRSSFQ